ncbi:MAG TPA: endonuclease domain-containing protein [Candidatus Binatia bacterium]|jgi:adenine-specific DNA-methyltransferase|nr:endonuclease domain-containing protein [Candidatus Binatia bacterium]
MEPQAAKLRDRARRLRHNQTKAEHRLWTRLRARQLCSAKFRRQHPIGPFIADFCCLESRLVVELDGGQHAVQAEADQRRSALMERRGYRVLRFWDNQVMAEIEAVLEQIAKVLREPSPEPSPCEGEGE